MLAIGGFEVLILLLGALLAAAAVLGALLLVRWAVRSGVAAGLRDAREGEGPAGEHKD